MRSAAPRAASSAAPSINCAASPTPAALFTASLLSARFYLGFYFDVKCPIVGAPEGVSGGHRDSSPPAAVALCPRARCALLPAGCPLSGTVDMGHSWRRGVFSDSACL